MLRYVAIALVAVVVVVLGVAATRPDTFTITRSTTMAAPPSVAFGLVNDFHRWAGWSPWDKLDPSMKRTFEGPTAGVGAKYAWVGNKDVGEGRMTIVGARADQQVDIKLEFLKPFAAENRTVFDFEPAGTAAAPAPPTTKVSWTMSGTNDLMGKLFSLVMDMEKMVGPDFEKGLAGMKELADKEAREEAERGAKAAAEAAAAAAAAAAATAAVAAPAPTAPAAAH
jgi:hypothetical protein